MPVEQDHELKETLTIDVITPGHAPRTETSLFKTTKQMLFKATAPALQIPRDEIGRCWICGQTEAELGHPLEAHHFSIERSFAEGKIDWEKVKHDHPHFDWSKFNESDPYTFVDDMEAQGVLLCKPHHTGKGTGAHDLPYGLWVMQRYLKDGAQFSPNEVIHHDQV
jgi:hypothetical protein